MAAQMITPTACNDDAGPRSMQPGATQLVWSWGSRRLGCYMASAGERTYNRGLGGRAPSGGPGDRAPVGDLEMMAF